MNITDWNWLTFLERAAKEPIPARVLIEAVDRADSWPTCACDELCQSLPMNDNGAPLDRKTCKLGVLFAEQVNDTNWPKAMETFRAI